MTDPQQRPNRAPAFWFVLAIHLALGTALYIHVQEKPVAKQQIEANQPIIAP